MGVNSDVECLDLRVRCQVQMEARKKWQHATAHRFDSLVASRRLASTSTYAAVPPTDAVRTSAATAPARPPLPAQAAAAGPPPPGRKHLAPDADQPAHGRDVIDDTVTSWVMPDDAARRDGCHGDGCHGYGDVSEGDCDAMCMTRLDRL